MSDNKCPAQEKLSSTSMNHTMHNGHSKKENEIACPEMCFYCFEVLVNYLNKIEPPKSPSFTNSAFPLFVTWQFGKDKRLRGCIGTFEPTNLHSGLKDYAIKSGTKDKRFDPIGRDELANLYVSVSILTNFEQAANYLDWEIGVHGIEIKFTTASGEERGATFLPEVAKEHGWNQDQTIDELIRKAGFRGPVSSKVRQSISLTRYRTEKITASYNDYQAWKNSQTSAS